MIIYKTTNKINGKIYIGKDEKNISTYYGSGLILNRSITKYGKENFHKETLEVCLTRKELNEREIYWINKLDSINPSIGYNITKGGTGGDIFSQLSENKRNEIREKLSNRKGWHHTDESKKIMSEKRKQYLKENPITDEQKEKYRELYTLKIPNEDICKEIFHKHFVDNMYLIEISNEFNLSELHIRRIFEYYGKTVSYDKIKNRKIYKLYGDNYLEIEKEIVNLYLTKNMSQKKLQKKFLLSEYSISEILKKNNILKRRSNLSFEQKRKNFIKTHGEYTMGIIMCHYYNNLSLKDIILKTGFSTELIYSVLKCNEIDYKSNKNL